MDTINNQMHCLYEGEINIVGENIFARALFPISSREPGYLGWYSLGRKVGIGRVFEPNSDQKWVLEGYKEVSSIPNIKIEDVNFFYK